MSQRIAWFSAGVSSFVAAYIAKPDRIIYIDVANQHPDSLRFVMDCQKHLEVPIEILRDIKYGGCVDNVITGRRYVNGPSGAQCTTLLKKRVRQEWERDNLTGDDVYIFGYDVDERHRAERLEAATIEASLEFPLIEHGLSKADAHGICERLGVKRPIMYDLGYPNNNCIGCVKGGKGYWNKIRTDFPEVFRRRAKQEREIGHSCIRGKFLDELRDDEGRMNIEIFPECSFMCVGIGSDES